MSLQDVLSTISVEPVEGELSEELLERRLEHCAALSQQACDDCVRLLMAARDWDPDDQRLLEELVILGLAWPALMGPHGLDLARLSQRLGEQQLLDERAEEARATLERATDLFPNDESLERILIAVLRETGDIETLAERCMARVKQELDAGRPSRAIPWLQEVLVSDPARRDVARKIRALRTQIDTGRQRRRIAWRALASFAVIASTIAALATRELDLRAAHATLPEADDTSIASIEQRLDALEAFAVAHPYWHGAHRVASEREELAVQVARLEAVEQARRADLQRQRAEQRGDADELMSGLEDLVRARRFDEALRNIERALELGGPDWGQRDRALADLTAVREYAAAIDEDPLTER